MNDYLIKEIKKYISNNRINYAILIDGEWGSGKTYFIKEELIPSLNNDIIQNDNKLSNEIKRPIYISLYGIDSLNSISEQIYLQLLGKGTKIASLGYSALKAFKPDLNYSEIMSTINDNVDLNNYVLIFDDLERVNLDINMCLAYINSFVEHNKIKVIIIANEKEIGKLDFNKNYELKLLSSMQMNINYNDPEKQDILNRKIDNKEPTISDIKDRVDRIYEVNYNYRLIKEKLIGKTYKYYTDLNIVNRLIDIYKYDDKYYKFLKNNKNILIDEIHLYNCNNLRTIKCILEDFYDLFLILEKVKIKFAKQMKAKVFINFIVNTINIKNGNKMLMWKDGDNYQTTCFGDDDHQSYYMYFLAFKFVDDYIMNNTVDKKTVENVINDYVNNNSNEFENGDSSFAKLKFYWELEDDELKKLLIELEKELKKGLYPCTMFPKIIVTLSCLENLEFECNLIDRIIKAMENRIKDDNGQNYYLNYDEIVRDEIILKIYNKNIERLKMATKTKTLQNNKNSIDTILDDNDWGIKLHNYLYDSENYNYFFNNKAFLSKLDIEKIIANISNSNSKNIYNFKYCIDRMYSANIKENYAGDKKSLEKLIDGISNLEIDKYGVSKKEALQYLKKILEEKFKLLC